MTWRIALLSAFVACTPLLAVADPVRFATNAEVTLPAGYAHTFEDAGKTIVVSPKQKDLFEYRLTFHSLVQFLSQRPTIAEDFVRSMAEKKGKTLLSIPDTGLEGFLEAGNPSTVNGERARNMHGVVALREGYTTMTLTVPEKHVNDPTVREFVGGGMATLLATLRYVDN